MLVGAERVAWGKVRVDPAEPLLDKGSKSGFT